MKGLLLYHSPRKLNVKLTSIKDIERDLPQLLECFIVDARTFSIPDGHAYDVWLDDNFLSNRGARPSFYVPETKDILCGRCFILRHDEDKMLSSSIPSDEVLSLVHFMQDTIFPGLTQALKELRAGGVA